MRANPNTPQAIDMPWTPLPVLSRPVALRRTLPLLVVLGGTFVSHTATCATANPTEPGALATPAPPAATPVGVPVTADALARTRRLLSQGRPLRIVLYGDSISEVGRSPRWHGGASAKKHNWGQVLGRNLRRRFPASSITVAHFGIGGHNSYEGLGRLDGLKPFRPDLVLVAFGANDCVYHYLEPQETRLALTSLARGIRERYACDAVLIGTAGDNPLAPTFRHRDETIAATAAAARDTGVPFVDLRPGMLQATDNGAQWTSYFLGKNNCHPNDAGHALWARLVEEQLIRFLTIVP